jgi:branched chain amino acid efflux pump
VAAGLSVLQTSLLSLLACTGGTQFAVVGVVTGGGTLGTALGGGLLLGARNTLYAMRLAPLLRVRGLRRFVALLAPRLRKADARAGAGEGEYLDWDHRAMSARAKSPPAATRPAPAARSGSQDAPLGGAAERHTRRVNQRIAAGAALIALALIPLTPPGVPVLAAATAVLLAGRLLPFGKSRRVPVPWHPPCGRAPRAGNRG